MARLVFAGREVWPFVEGGGIGRYVWTAASMLAQHHEVTILTSDAHRAEHDRLHAANDPRLPVGVAFAFAAEPQGDVTPASFFGQAWSVALLDAAAALGADLIEFGDYMGEGFATVHARRGGDPRLRATTVAIRAHTSAEIVAELNEAPVSRSNGLIWATERFPIRHADALLWPGGDVLERYRGFYGRTADPVELPLPVRLEDLLPAADVRPPAEGPMRLLFLNRLERRKGVLEMVEALLDLPGAGVVLTLVGRDTDTAPGGGSMREHLERLLGDDPRFEIRGQVPHGEVPALIAAHHAVAVPVRWETFSYVTREALAAGRPVLATAVGAIPDVVVPGRSGWLARSSDPADLRAALATIDREAAERLIDSGDPRAVLEASLQDPERLAAAYAELAGRGERRATQSPERIEAVVSVQPGDADLDRTLHSLRAQHGAAVHTTLVAAPDALPSARLQLDADRVIVHHGSRLEAWAKGVHEAAADLILLLPSGAELEPGFSRRAAEALAEGPQFDYVTANAARGRRPWHAPLGGEDLAVTGVDAGASVALARRAALLQAFERGPGSEAELWTGQVGVVMQEPLVRRLPRRSVAGATS